MSLSKRVRAWLMVFSRASVLARLAAFWAAFTATMRMLNSSTMIVTTMRISTIVKARRSWR
jgi:hypothetical protein